MFIPLPQRPALTLNEDVKSTDSGDYFCKLNQFALPVKGNKVEQLASGADAFAGMLGAMRAAQKFIWIADWQMAYDVELEKRGESGHPGRLIEVIRSIIKDKAVHVRVLLYRSVLDQVPGTFDGLVAREINAINDKDYPGSVIVLLQGSTSAQLDGWGYSHHQKFMVVDGSVGFIGGLDLSYGRYSTPEFDVVCDPSRSVLNEMYNPCATKLRGMAPHEVELVEQGFAKPYAALGSKVGYLIDEGCQPLMPWQDVHMKLSGPAVVDMHRNFVRRWNACVNATRAIEGRNAGLAQARSTGSREDSPRSPKLIDKAWLDDRGATALLKEAQASQPGGATVQIVRSVSSRHLKLEAGYYRKAEIPDDIELYTDAGVRKAMTDSIKDWRNHHQANILDAMVHCIRSADNYIYIETQFFISPFGTASGVDSSKLGNEDNGVKNTIVDELAQRIAAHIVANLNFHVYLVLPVHPEGAISDGSVWKQHWLALATIHHGDASLIGRIKAALVKAGKDPGGWNRYLTVLNMRNYGVAVQYARDPKTWREDFTCEIGRYVITEQIYIHSKLMIVDDAVAIVGSANINDRSLTGNGDTELAAVVVDREGIELKDLGEPGFKVQTRKFARDLRRSLWEKHFGFALNSGNYFESTERAVRAGAPAVKIAENPPREPMTTDSFRRKAKNEWQSVLDKPCHPDTVEAIQTIAAGNARAYEAVFPQVPRNGMKKFDEILKQYVRPYPAVVAATVRDPQALPDSASEKARGVVPPQLGPAYMTATLMPHQQEGAQIGMSDVGNRYVTFERGQVHDINKAIGDLKRDVLGFFVLMPLNWGDGMEVDKGVANHHGVGLARGDVKGPPGEVST